MHLSILPAGPARIASSRIRVYSLLAPLARLGVTARIGLSDQADALLIQKRLDPEILSAARAAKDRGVLVLYDCDDLGAALHGWAKPPLVQQMISLADVVTTNTEAFRSALCREHGALCTEILPDAVDYGLTSPVTIPPETAEPLRLLWFGNCTNISLIAPYFLYLASIPACELVLCTHHCARTRRMTAGFPGLVPVPWSLESFPSVLRSCHLSLLTHDGEAADRAKSNNRMVASIAWGVPALVSRTPEYVSTALRAGVTDALFDGPADLRRVVELHRSAAARQHYLERAQPVVWRHHAPEVIARRLVDILQRHLDPDAVERHAARDNLI
jgi:hypothetical protein